MTSRTIQSLQANLPSLLDAQEAGTLGTVDVIKTSGGAAVAKLVKWATFNSANIAGTSTLNYVPQLSLEQSPSAGSHNSLYQLTKEAVDASAIVDGTVHAAKNYVGKTLPSASGVLFTAKLGGAQGNAIKVAVVDPLAINQALSVTYAAPVITVHLKTDAGGNLDSTFTEIANAVNNSVVASALVTATVVGTGTAKPESTAATLQVTQGAGGVLYTAAASGVAGNSVTVRYLNPTVLGHSHYSYPDGVQGGNGLDLTAVATGISPVTVTVVDPGVNHVLSSLVVGNAITITLGYSVGAIDTDLTTLNTHINTDVDISALISSAVTGVGATLATAMSVQTLSSLFVESAGKIGSALTVNLGTNAAGTITSTASSVAAAATGVAAGLYTAAATGVGGTVAAALVLTNLAGGNDDGTLAAAFLTGGANQPAGADLFKAYAIYRKRTHSKNVGVSPSLTPRAVLISTAHATLLGL